MFFDFLVQVAVVGVLHDNANGVSGFVEEGLPVLDDVGTFEAGEDSDFIDGVLFFFFGKVV